MSHKIEENAISETINPMVAPLMPGGPNDIII